MFKTSIRRKVMKVIESRIKEAQKAHDAELAELKSGLKEERINLCEKFEYDLKNLLRRHKEVEVNVAEKHVNNILSKIL